MRARRLPRWVEIAYSALREPCLTPYNLTLLPQPLPDVASECFQTGQTALQAVVNTFIVKLPVEVHKQVTEPRHVYQRLGAFGGENGRIPQDAKDIRIILWRP